MDLASSMAAELAGASYRAAGAEENASCDPSSSDGNASEGTARSTSGDFVYHRVCFLAPPASLVPRCAVQFPPTVVLMAFPCVQVTKLDTLAGLAIKYNITVGCRWASPWWLNFAPGTVWPLNRHCSCIGSGPNAV